MLPLTRWFLLFMQRTLLVGSLALALAGSCRAATYYMSATGNDANAGTSASTPWLTPNHAVNCGDVILASAGTYPSLTTFGTVSCSAGNNVAWLQCATFDTCKVSVTSGTLDGIRVGQSYWGVQGWEVDNKAGGTGGGNCFSAIPATTGAGIHHIIFANDIANTCPASGFAMAPNGSAGVDYWSVVGNIAYGAGATSTACGSGISAYEPVASDTVAGTHIYIAGNFAYGNTNPSGCYNGNGITLDTFDGSQTGLAASYAQQALVDNNICVSNGGNGLRVQYNSAGAGPSYSAVQLRHNTLWGNNLATTEAGGPSCGELKLYKTENTQAYLNVASTNAAQCFGGTANPAYAFDVDTVDATDFVCNSLGWSASGTTTNANASPAFTFGPNNVTNTSPAFAGAATPAAPNCSSSSSVATCMASVVANFTATASAAATFGYVAPSATPVYDALFPSWLCNVNLPAGLVTPGCVAANVVLNSATIVNAAPAKFGLNVGPITNYDSGQIFKNLFYPDDAGMEPQAVVQTWTINAGASPLSTTQVNSNEINSQYDPVAANFWVGGTITIVQPGAAPGSDILCSSVITANTVAGSSPAGATYTFSPACPTVPAVGDVFVIRKLAPTQSSDWNCNPAANCVAETTDLCPTCGSQALEFNAASAQTSRQIYLDGEGQDRWVLVNGGTWTYSYQGKLASGSGTFQTLIERGDSSFLCGPWTDTLTSTWTKYTHTCTPNDPAAAPTLILASFTASKGAVVYQDNIDFEQTSGISAANTTIFRDAFVNALSNYYENSTGSASPGTCRYPGHLAAMNLSEFTQTNLFATPSVTVGNWVYSLLYGGGEYPTMPEFLQLAQLVGCQPEFILPITFSVADAQGFVDYLAGGSTTTYGALRIAQGQTTPWSSVFPNIYVSFGNENWNTGFVSQAIGFRSGSPTLYYDYMQRAKTIFTAMRGQPSYSASIKLVVGTQTAVQAGTSEIAYANPDLIEIGGYYGLTVNDSSTLDLLLKPTFSQLYDMNHDASNQDGFYQSFHAYNAMNVCGPSHTAACRTMVYEENTAPIVGTGITQANEDIAAAGGGTGVTAAQQFLQGLQSGITVQNLYSLTGYLNSGPNGLSAKVWSAVVDMGGATNNVRPTFLGAQLANQCVIGPMFSAAITSPDTYVLPANNNGVNAGTYPAEFAYAFANGTTRAVCLTNMDIDNAHLVSFSGPDAPPLGSTVSQIQLAPSLTALNEAAGTSSTVGVLPTVALTSSTLSSFNPSAGFLLPAHSATLLTYTVAASPAKVQASAHPRIR